MATGVGSAVIDFGAAPGSNEADVDVTGQTGISGTSHVEAWFMYEASADHTADDHAYAPRFISLTCTAPAAGVGFTIVGRSEHKMTGKWSVRWVWAD